MTFVQNTLFDGDDLSIQDLQDIVNNQEIAYNVLQSAPKGILRYSVNANDVVVSSTTGSTELDSITWAAFDLTRIYRIGTYYSTINGVADTTGYMDIVDVTTGDRLRGSFFRIPNGPNLYAYFKPKYTLHTFSWRGGVNKGLNTTYNSNKRWTLNNSLSQRSGLYIQDMGTALAGSII